MKKLQARDKQERKKTVRIDLPPETLPPSSPIQKTIGVINAFNLPNTTTTAADTKRRERAMTLDTSLHEVNLFIFEFF
jgi:hypothetical protein